MLGVSKSNTQGAKVKSTAEVGEQRMKETFGGFGESTNIKRAREDYANSLRKKQR